MRIESLHNKEFGTIRMIEEDGKYLFCGVDVAFALGYTNACDAIRRHCKGVVKRDSLTQGGVQELSFIPEGDVYRLITHSKLPSAEAFEKWVFDDVLPTIRRHGAYMMPSITKQVMDSPEMIYQMAEQMLTERSKNAELTHALAVVKPKVDFYDAFIHPEDCTNIRITAKELNIPEKLFTGFLIRRRYLYRCPAGNLMPYAKPSNEALFLVKDYITAGGYHGAYTLITPRGKLHFLNLLDEMME